MLLLESNLTLARGYLGKRLGTMHKKGWEKECDAPPHIGDPRHSATTSDGTDSTNV